MGRSKAEEKLLQKELKEAGQHIKKIIAGGGKIKGVFYFAGTGMRPGTMRTQAWCRWNWIPKSILVERTVL